MDKVVGVAWADGAGVGRKQRTDDASTLVEELVADGIPERNIRSLTEAEWNSPEFSDDEESDD